MLRLGKEFAVVAGLTLAGVAFSLVSGLASPPWRPPPLEPGEIRLPEARALDPIWIDARPRQAYEKAHIPGAIHLNANTWETGVGELMDAWLPDPRPIVVYCDSEACGTSERVAADLRESLPDAQIHTLKGGWSAWPR